MRPARPRRMITPSKDAFDHAPSFNSEPTRSCQRTETERDRG